MFRMEELKISVFALVSAAGLVLSAPLARAASECGGELPSWIQLSSVEFDVSDLRGPVRVKVDFPDVRSLPCLMGGDWGPDYFFTLSESTPVRVTLSDPETGRAFRESRETRHLTAESTMLAAERAVTPHYYTVSLREVGLRFQIYIHASEGPQFVRVGEQEAGSDYRFRLREQVPVRSFQ